MRPHLLSVCLPLVGSHTHQLAFPSFPILKIRPPPLTM